MRVDIFAGETLTDAFAALNPLRETPVLELDSGATVTQSNAILSFLAEGAPFLPAVFGYGHVAAEAGLEPGEHVAAWMERVRALPASWPISSPTARTRARAPGGRSTTELRCLSLELGLG